MAEYVHSPTPMMALSQPREGPGSDDDDDEKRSSSGGVYKGRLDVAAAPSASSAGTVSGRKPRGRPPGSKNKPKPPVVITRESESAMHPMVLELSSGCDVLETLSAFAHRRRVGMSVLSGSGAVANVSLRHPGSHASTITLSGRFDILSLAGSFLPSKTSVFTISLAGAQGQVIGGTVAGGMTAAGTVVVVAATFGSPEYHRLPAAAEEEVEGKEEDVKPVMEGVSVGGFSGGAGPSLSGQMAQEMVLWGTPRPAPHSHHPPPHY